MIIKYNYISQLNEGRGHLIYDTISFIDVITIFRDASQIADLFTKPTPKHLFFRMDSSHSDSTRKAIP